MGSKTCHLKLYIYLHFSLLFVELILSWRSKEKVEKRKLNEHVPLELHMQWRVRFNTKYVWAYLSDT